MTIHSLIILPIGAEFRVLPVSHVGEGTAPTDALPAVGLRVVDGVEAATLVIPRLGRLEGVWALRGFRIPDLAANLSLTLHYLLHLLVLFDGIGYALELLLDLQLCLPELILHGKAPIVAYKA